MNIKWSRLVLFLLFGCLLVQLNARANSYSPTSQSAEQPATPATQQYQQSVHQLLAPLPVYRHALVAQVLSASTYPTEIVEADRWMQNHSNLKGEELAAEVDKQAWDPSVKALTQFPSVLET